MIIAADLKIFSSNLFKKVDHWYEENRKEHLPCLAILALQETTKLEQNRRQPFFFLTGRNPDDKD